MKRRRIVTALVLAWSMLLGGVAVAGELEDFLRGAAAAEFSGQQVVVTFTDGETAAGFYEVTQSGGFTMLEADSGMAMMGEGRVSSADGGGEGHLRVADWSAWRLSDRYSLGSVDRTIRLGRPASLVTIFEDGLLRTRMAFDNETGAPMLSEVYDGSGALFRIAMVTGFSAEVVTSRMGDTGNLDEYTMLMPAPMFRLPESAGGYWRADTYQGPDLSLHAFYTDGLFSFSVFELDSRAKAGPLEDGAEVEIDDRRYRRVIDPGGVWIFWRAPDNSYLLVGDLPPDHLDEVLPDLPHPGRPNVFKRIWRGLFG